MKQLNKSFEFTPLVLNEGSSAYLFYGGPGTGKTTAAIQALRNFDTDARMLVFDMDRKLPSMMNLDPELVKRVDIWQPTAALSGESMINIARVERKDEKGKPIAGTQGFIPPNPRGYMELVDAINSTISSPDPRHAIYVVDSFTTAVEHLMRSDLSSPSGQRVYPAVMGSLRYQHRGIPGRLSIIARQAHLDLPHHHP